MPILILHSSKRDLEICMEPPADVYRTPSGWTIKVELAGVDPRDIKIELNRNMLSISGIRRDWILERNWRHHSMEISYCRFRRDLVLPQGEDPVLISTEYKHGMLLIHIALEGKEI